MHHVLIILLTLFIGVQSTGAKPYLPSSVDLSTSRAFPPVIEQQGNSCAQYAAGYYILGYSLNLARGNSASLKQNQIAAYHPWNFLNHAKNNGSEFGDSWAIAKHMGLPSVVDYGTQSKADIGRWMSGYDKYYRAMKNRAADWHLIDLTTKDGLHSAKQWLHNRHQIGLKGGLLAADFQTKGLQLVTIERNQPKAGLKIIKQWGRSGGGHLMTYVGYDDSVGYDFNGDGKITNNIDLNKDGEINLADYERGCFILANSWGSKWANKGFVYSPYREHAVSGWERGKWVGTLKVNTNYQPRVTLRLKMKCSDRSALQVSWAKSTTGSRHEPLNFTDSPLFRRSPLMPLNQPKSSEKFVQYATKSYKLGRVPLQGAIKGSPFEIGFDLTDDFGSLKNLSGQIAALRITLHDSKNSSHTATVHEAELIFYSKTGKVRRRQALTRKKIAVNKTLLLSTKIPTRG